MEKEIGLEELGFAYWYQKQPGAQPMTRNQFQFMQFLLEHKKEIDVIGGLHIIFESVYDYIKYSNPKENAMAQKWIINNNQLRAGHVDLHRELATDHTTTKGGGWWWLDRDKNIMYLYGKSMDFGQVTLEDVQEAYKPGFLSKHQIVFSTSENIGAVLKMEPNIIPQT